MYATINGSSTGSASLQTVGLATLKMEETKVGNLIRPIPILPDSNTTVVKVFARVKYMVAVVIRDAEYFPRVKLTNVKGISF